jgi:CRP-like cAMP-binding protein
MPAGLRNAGTVRLLAAGAALFRQGDRAGAVFQVVSGRLRLARQTIEGQSITLHTAEPSQMFAEAALFSPVYHCDAVAAVGSEVRAWRKADLLAAFRRDPDLAERFMAALARQVQALRAQLAARNILSARERVLHQLALRAGADGRTVRLRGTLMEFAAEIGLTPAALYRTLARLEREGLIVRPTTGTLLLAKVDV